MVEERGPSPGGKSEARMSGMVGRALRMMVGTLASRILGLLREVLTAAFFGATRSLDAYYVAYTLANLSRQLLAEGALSASFVPVFSRVHKNEGEASAFRLARQVLTILLVAGTAAVLLGMLCSPLLVRIIAPGFDADDARLAVTLTRALFPFLLIVSVGALAMGVLNSIGSFFVPAVAPALSNLAFIVILLIGYNGVSVWTLVAAVLIGGLCNMSLQWLWAAKLGAPLLPSRPNLENSDLRETLTLFLPYAAGLSLNQINPVISRMLGSFLEGGVISALTYADRVIQLPLGLFVIAVSQAALPMLSRLDRDDGEGFADFVADALRFNLFIVLPAAIGLILAAGPIVHLLFFRGAFGAWAWEATSGALACYAAGLPGTACNTVIMRALYARGLPKAAIIVTAFTVASNLTLGALLMGPFTYRGLAVGTSVAFTGAAFVGAFLLSRDIGLPIRVFGSVWLARTLINCAAITAAVCAFKRFFPYDMGAAFSMRALWILALVALGMLVYTIVSKLIRSPEWVWIGGALRR